MELVLTRIAKRPTYTIGKLYVDGKYVCDTLEDTDRGLDKSMPLSKITSTKVYGETAIPTGKYQVIVSYSNKFKQYMPLLLNVPGYEGIRIHSGNTAADTLGCILVGKNTQVGKVLDSRNTYKQIFSLIETACKTEKIYITIK